ncbi:MAG: hypothetical protein BGO69_03000 [Bacteroidetes bacterium 46-16]|mgnify:CR=1 FL=1|nr:MAG: hypothetical protein BGO69_03000 [Bacteroidetes bacterium 46-16]
MIYHIVVGDIAAGPLKEAISMEPELKGEVLVLKDILHVGPLQKQEGQSFSELRSAYWQEVAPNVKEPIEVDDMERLLEVSNVMYKDEEAVAWFWMAPWPADVCAYHWMLRYLSKHPGRFYLLNIAGLPFLDENGKVYYPKSIGEILPKELVKARRLARQVTPAEVEVDGEEWNKLVQENEGIRVHEGGKKLLSKPADHYDKQLVSFCSHQYQKASRIVGQALNKYKIPTGDLHLGWRLRKIAETGALLSQGDPAKTLKDFDVKLPGGDTPKDEAIPVENAG